MYITMMMLSSPCGDKLQFHRRRMFIDLVGYRPLAGISCNPGAKEPHYGEGVIVPLRG